MSISVAMSSAALLVLAVGAFVLFDMQKDVTLKRRLFKPYMTVSAGVTIVWFGTVGFAWPVFLVAAVLVCGIAWGVVRGSRFCAACAALALSQNLFGVPSRCRACGASLLNSGPDHA